MIFKAVLSNKAHPEYGQVTIPFPIPENKYERTLDLLDSICVGSPSAQDCQVDELDGAYPILSCLAAQNVNVDELDYLAKRLDSFDDGEDVQFEAMASKLGLSNIKDFINLTFCCQQATVISDFSKLEQVGKTHSLNIRGGSIPTEEFNKLDGKAVALDLIQSGTGVVTPYGVVFDNGMKLEQVYDGHSFPQYLHSAALLTLGVPVAQETGDSTETTWLYLPAPGCQIARSLHRIGITNGSAGYFIEDSGLSSGVLEALQSSSVDIFELNRVCQAISGLRPGELQKLEAVVIMAQPRDAWEVRQLVENLEQFDFIPALQTPEDYGRYMIQMSGHFEYDENLEGFYDYRLYGEQRVQQEGGQFNECGYVAYHGPIELVELMENNPYQHLASGMETNGMGGMA